MEGKPSGGAYFTSPLVNLAAEARIAEIGVLFFGSPIPKLMTASPRSRRRRASSLRAKVGDSAISLANLLNFMFLLNSKTSEVCRAAEKCEGWCEASEDWLQNKIWSESSSDQI